MISDELFMEFGAMSEVLRSWQLLMMALVGFINRQQQSVIDYLVVENKVLKEKIGKKRIMLDDNQRRRLEVKGKILGRKATDFSKLT